MIPNSKFQILVLIGPTSSGKSELAVQLAKLYNSEIVSCDSRQVYRGMDIGTGKVPGHWKKTKLNGPSILSFLYKGIPHHCIDFANPKKQYSVSEFKQQAQKAITEIIKRGKLPILCGGTGHWIDAVVYDQNIPDVKPNKKLRSELEKKSAADLYQQIKKLDPQRAKSIDRHNKRRLIRALEIVITTGKPVPQSAIHNSQSAIYDILWLGINPAQDVLYEKIDNRLNQRLKYGMVKEVQKLHRSGLSWRKLESFGLEYKYLSLYLQKKLTYQQMVSQLSFAIKHYAKRQMTWWKRNKDIIWL